MAKIAAETKSVLGIECRICFEPPKIPVFFICFACDAVAHGGPSCNSISRVCLSCARRYLELDKPKKNRSLEKRCLHCQMVVNPRMLNAFSAYKKDYLLMNLDPTVYTCIHEGCEYKGTQNALDRHIRSECQYRCMYCHGCRQHIIARLLADHVENECVGYTNCPQCEEKILHSIMEAHMDEVHQLSICEACHQWVGHEQKMDHEQRECPFRLVQCRYCQSSVMMVEMANHLQIKSEWINEQMAALETQIDVLTHSLDQWKLLHSHVRMDLNNNMDPMNQ